MALDNRELAIDGQIEELQNNRPKENTAENEPTIDLAPDHLFAASIGLRYPETAYVDQRQRHARLPTYPERYP